MQTIVLSVLALAFFPVDLRAAPAPKDLIPKPGQVVEVEIAKGVKMKFCWVPAGEAQLGSPKAERQEVLKQIKEDKEPEWLSSEAEELRGKFKTKGFWLGKYAVTQGEWEAVIGGNPSYFVSSQNTVKKAMINGTSRFPVERISWEDCQEFLKKLNKEAKSESLGEGKFTLPHEDEWEYACRGGKGNKQAYYFGNELNGTQANCEGNQPYGTLGKGPYLERTCEVGSYEAVAPHPWGLCDMSGNVWQWCNNLYRNDETVRVVRGGSCFDNSRYCRSADRFGHVPAFRLRSLGCRVAFILD